MNLKVLVCGLAMTSMSVAAMAQPSTGAKQHPAGKQPAGQNQNAQPRGQGRGQGGMMGEPLSAEKAKAAWDLEATGVATRLGLNADQTKALVKAYEDARTSHQAAVEKLRAEQREKMKDMDQEDRRDAMQEFRKANEDLNKNEREKFTKAVTSSISGESGSKAATALGVFSPMWDRMVDTIGGFKLEAAKQQDALNAVEEFVGAQTKAMQNAGPDADREAMRDQMQAAHDKLNASLKKDLSEEQMKKFEESMPGRGRGMGGGRNRGPGGPGGEKPDSDK